VVRSSWVPVRKAAKDTVRPAQLSANGDQIFCYAILTGLLERLLIEEFAMIHDLTCNAIGLVYMAAFLHAFSHAKATKLWDRFVQITHEQYCHLALGILYPLSVLHG
jgi:hypothetical protein